MSAEPNQTPEPAAAPAPAESSAAPAQQQEAPAIRVGNSSALIARAGDEMVRQLRAAEEGSRTPSSPEVADEGTTSGTPAEGEQPATPPQTPEPSEVEKLRQRLDELEKERQQAAETRRASELQTLSLQQQREFQELEADVTAAQQKVARDKARLDSLAVEYQNAVDERDYDTVEAITQAYYEQQQDVAISERAAWRLQQQRDQFKSYADNQYHEAHLREQASQIGKIASKYGLTPDDLKAVNPKLDVTKPFEVLDVVTQALHNKLKTDLSAKDKTAKEQLEAKQRELLDKFDNSPGAQPHPGGSTNIAGAQPPMIRVGNSKAMLERAWKNQR